MSTYENTATKQDVYQRVTDSIVTAIEQGAGQYRMPWVVWQDVGVQVRDGGNRAYYRPDTPEAVYMPGFDQFPDKLDYYSTLAHETTHWTSHASRCDRQLGKRFGDAAYAMEELVAELGSAYTMASLELELTPRKDHAAYIDSWLKVLRSDKRAIFTAASQAQKAADWLTEQSWRTQTREVAEVAA